MRQKRASFRLFFRLFSTNIDKLLITNKLNLQRNPKVMRQSAFFSLLINNLACLITFFYWVQIELRVMEFVTLSNTVSLYFVIHSFMPTLKNGHYYNYDPLAIFTGFAIYIL